MTWKIAQCIFPTYKATASPLGATSHMTLSTVVSATPNATNLATAVVTIKAIAWTLTRAATYTAVTFRTKGEMHVSATRTAGSTQQGVAQIGIASAPTRCV